MLTFLYFALAWYVVGFLSTFILAILHNTIDRREIVFSVMDLVMVAFLAIFGIFMIFALVPVFFKWFEYLDLETVALIKRKPKK